MKKVGIVSCDKWISKIKEDLYLNQELLSLGIISDIISWEDTSIDYSEYDCLILRSVWGYQDKLTDFYNWLELVEQSGVQLFNSPEIIKDNIRKDVQFNTLKKYGIPTVETKFLYDRDLINGISKPVLEAMKRYFTETQVFVIKPIISGSGNNTYLLDLTGSNQRINNIQINQLDNIFNAIIKEQNNGLMLQPFITGIDNGEVSSIFIDGQNTYNVRRYPTIFHDKKREELETDISSGMSELAQSVETTPEFRDYLYMRVDMVEQDGKPIIMEVEMTEPDLLTRYIPEETRDSAIKTFAKTIDRRV